MSKLKATDFELGQVKAMTDNILSIKKDQSERISDDQVRIMAEFISALVDEVIELRHANT